MIGKNNRSSAHTTEHSPQYDLSDKGFRKTLTVGAAMMTMTIAGMLLVADTMIAKAMFAVYSNPIIGVLVVGSLLTGGRHLGLKGVSDDNLPLALTGSAVLILTYSCLGGAILTPYSSGIYTPAIVVSGLVTVVISLIAGAYVYSTDKNLSHWKMYSGYAFLGVIITALIGTFYTPLLIASFILGLLGFVADLVYEIWMTSNKNRSAEANGIALYVAFAGVFVHILRIVLEVMAQE